MIELRVLHSQHQQRTPVTLSGYFNDHRKLANCAVEVSQYARGVYITLNKVDDAVIARGANRLRI